VNLEALMTPVAIEQQCREAAVVEINGAPTRASARREERRLEAALIAVSPDIPVNSERLDAHQMVGQGVSSAERAARLSAILRLACGGQRLRRPSSWRGWRLPSVRASPVAMRNRLAVATAGYTCAPMSAGWGWGDPYIAPESTIFFAVATTGESRASFRSGEAQQELHNVPVPANNVLLFWAGCSDGRVLNYDARGLESL